jgi:hypothetical protein
LYQYTRTIKLTVVIVILFFFLQNSSLKVKSTCRLNLGINSVSFHITVRLWIKYFAFIRYCRKKNGSTMRQSLGIIDFKTDYDSVRKEVLYSIHLESGITMKLDRLVKMCLNDTYSKVYVNKHLSDMFCIQNGLKKETFFCHAFQLCFSIYH